MISMDDEPNPGNLDAEQAAEDAHAKHGEENAIPDLPDLDVIEPGDLEETAAPLTEEEVRAWAEGDKLACPRCKKMDEVTLDYDSYDSEDWTVWQNVRCTNCGVEFQVIYDFTRVDVGKGNGPEFDVAESKRINDLTALVQELLDSDLMPEEKRAEARKLLGLPEGNNVEPTTTTGVQLGHHCAADKNKPHLYAESPTTACRQVFVALSGGTVGCPVHGIVDSLEAAFDRRQREAEAAAQRFKQRISQELTAATSVPTEKEEGIYMLDGDVVKVQLAVHGSGKPYAKKLNKETGRWDYVPGLVSKLKPEHKLTQEQAKEFGLLYGRCAICGRTLTREESIERAMGPVCAAKMGWA